MEAHLNAIAKLKKNFWARSWASISDQQTFARNDPKPGSVRRIVFKAPTDSNVVEALLSAFDGLKHDTIEQCLHPTQVDVPTEWMINDGATTKDDEALASMPTILYVHGGGFYFGSPVMARPATKALAKLSAARCVAVQYRWATEQPFPAALLDLFTAFLSLRTGDESTGRASVPADQIVLCGESSGLNLCLSLIQLLLHLRTGRDTITFHGRSLPLHLPAGVCGLSGFNDVTCALPSWTKNDAFDFVPAWQPSYTPQWIEQDAWPASPARADIYCERSAMCHPLVSPVAAKSWKGAPPMWMACGQERGADATLFLAQQAAKDGVTVQVGQYEAMPHIWPIVLPKLPQSRRAFEHWAFACQRMLDDKKERRPTTSSAEFVSFEGMKSTVLDVARLCPFSRQDIMTMMEKKRGERFLAVRKADISKKSSSLL